MLERISRVDCSHLQWVACPDVVADAQQTIDRWLEWFPIINRLRLPAAFVAQDGLELISDQIPWGDMSTLFIGGSTNWKESPAAYDFGLEAKRRGKWVHIGRVNTQARIKHFSEMGADSIDGTGFSKWPKRIPDGLRWIEKHRRPLFESISR